MSKEPPKKQTRTRRKTTYKGASEKKTSGIVPRTDNQGELIKAINSSSQVIVFGPSGTGKTYVTATCAADLYTLKDIDKIVITRPHVAVGKDIGYLPGTLEEKVQPWALPVLDVLTKHLGKGVVETGIKNGNVEVAPLALMRGRSFDDAFIICDEAQNISTHELKMLLTRVGEGSTIVLNGDVQQTDLKEGDGLTKITHLAKKHMLPVPIIEFTLDDIVRSDICAMWTKVFYEEKI
ncbi:phosphate starvation-inducible protein [Celeribacter phage P12053L]|uniref:PhoH-like protein n=1 Tax=Celeribacter phage P12053L TaxID=1197951 RepID=I6R9K2_9CAUD|nr:PhoH-like phosphate starvation-inducible [Celeribacter phage P12053L]AFM54639.1 phosphate starvation-inducible protein [Celeribacter phage P12053L]